MIAESMKTDSIAGLKVKRAKEKRCQLSIGSLIVAFAVLQSSCSTPGTSKIQAEGLTPQIADRQATEISGSQASDPLPSDTFSSLQTPLFSAEAATARAVAGKPGFVYSPHTAEPLEVDVRDYQAGARVRCPYTKQAFVIPGGPESTIEPAQRTIREVPQPETQIASRQAVPEQTAPSIETPTESSPTEEAPIGIVEPREVASPEIESVSPIDPADPILREEPRPKQIAAGAEDLPNSSDILAPLSTPVAGDVPIGKWVTGKPNYVYSPFAASNQVVDVEGHAPGTQVKCPYTGKVFAVPERDSSPQE